MSLDGIARKVEATSPRTVTSDDHEPDHIQATVVAEPAAHDGIEWTFAMLRSR
jgi:hypothetical protein